MRDLDGHYRFRDELVRSLRRDVMGPADEAEILNEEPATSYITGVLFPQTQDGDELLNRSGELDGDLAPSTLTVDEIPDTGVSLANRQMPSAMGLTFAVDPARASTLTITATAARYEPIDAEGHVTEARRVERRSMDEQSIRWRRRPLTLLPTTIDVDHPADLTAELASGDALTLRVRVRKPDESGAVPVTVTLVNAATAKRAELLDASAFFQCGVRIDAPEGSRALVERRPPQDGLSQADKNDLDSTRLLYRHVPMFATGHGCAAVWDTASAAPGGPVVGLSGTDAVWSEFVPAHEVLLTDSNPGIDEPRMVDLAEAAAEEVTATLSVLVDGYRQWIADRRADVEDRLESEFREVALRHLAECRDACDRMESGIARLRADPVVLEAFRAANSAMADQRARTSWIQGGCKGEPDRLAQRWRPFQIGFILMCLDGIVDSEHEDRSRADVLWFPTGGGKTEAYLGLIAFTTFLRRLRNGDRGGGVTVLMRYTLRLLTLQQFERAAALICAMECMRRAQPGSFGKEKISIGMWVGQGSTPNKLADAEESLQKLRDGEQLQEMDPVQLRACPWCGTAMDAHDYHVDAGGAGMSIACRNAGCDFRSGIPVHVVDEDLYAVRPTLVIATADKFVQVAWRGEVARLFNREGAAAGTPPPELIIQDELHLIAGPLGSLAGLYETAIDIAADRPKVIASTATIRRATEQGTRLFARDVRQFPPPGLDARDSWFAVETPRARKGSRLYVGLLTPSTSQATLLIRTYAALLHHVGTNPAEDEVRDSYWTLVGYFNSLRLLSAAELQVHDDVEERLKQLATRDESTARQVQVYRELTSRRSSSEIPDVLKELFRRYPDANATDVVLATNMISVGVDVNRLGLMAMMGQPQATAEYIQATSRVGRRDPGLVVTLFNSARSRDRSHYEHFTAFHGALYRQVEATSVTPFSARARDRALRAVLVGLLRMLHPVARANRSAASIEHFLGAVEEVRAKILERIDAIDPAQRSDADRQLGEFIEAWRRLAEENTALTYEASYRPPGAAPRDANAALLSSYGTDSDLEYASPTMWSLRDVDVESAIFLEA